MKKILLSIVILLLILFLFSIFSNKKITSPERQKLEWCYGIYHSTKSTQETEEQDQVIIQNDNSKDILDSEYYRQGLKESETVSSIQKTECYDLIYPYLSTLGQTQTELIYSKPYCFGYLEKARGTSYIPVFCQKKCSLMTMENCEKICEEDLKRNLKKDRINEGKKDAENAHPTQFIQCLDELKGMM